jgi:tetratricopeptide (TPR) repeat protein
MPRMNDWPTSLIERIKGRQAILVAGLGCSRLVGRAGWAQLAEQLIEWLESEDERERVRELLAAGRIATAITFLRARLADEVVIEVLKDAYPSGTRAEGAAAKNLGLIARIPWRGVIATGFDDLWEGLLNTDAESPVPAFLARDAQALGRHRGRFVLRLCGTVAAPETICLSPADLRRRVTPTGITDVVDELYERWSFVFLGFGPDDPDFRLVSQRLLGANIAGLEHFLLYPGEPGFEAQLVSAEQGLTAVPTTGTLEEVVHALAEAWNAVAAEARPPEDDLESWLEIWGRDTGDEESRAVLRRAEERLQGAKEWERLVELHLNQVERLAAAPAEQVAHLREVGRVFDVEMEAPDRGFAALLTAFGLASDAPGLQDDVLRLAGKAGTWGDLATEYGEIIKAVADPVARARHLLELGRIYAEELNQVEPAIAEYQRALATAPDGGSGRALRESSRAALADLLAKQESWSELARVLGDSAAAVAGNEGGSGDVERPAADPVREIALRLRLGEVQAQRIGDVDAALATYERVRELDPSSIKAQEALEPLYRKKERWPDLARLLEEKGRRTTSPEEAARIRGERAEVLERAGDVDASISTLEAVVTSDPTNRAALRSLEKLYDKQGREQEYLRTLERLAEVVEERGEKLMLLRRLAAEWDERPEGVDRAAEALEQILQIDPRDEDAFRALGRVYRQSKRWLPLVEALNRQIAVSAGTPGVRDLHATLGRVLDEELHDPDKAIDAYAAALRAGDQRAPTLAALARLYELRTMWKQAAETLDRSAEVARDAPARAAALFHAGGLWAEKLSDRAAAEDRYTRALAAVPDDPATLEALAGIYRGKGETARAANTYIDAATLAPAPSQKARLLTEAGMLFQDDLDDRLRAQTLFAQALVSDPEDRRAGERLVPIYLESGRFAEVEPVLQMLLRHATADQTGSVEEGRARVADVESRLGFAAHKLGKLDQAVAAFERALALAPTSLPALAGLADLQLERKAWPEVARVYRSMLAHHEAALPEKELLDVYVRLGRATTELGDREAALAYYEKASAQGGHNRTALEGIASLHADEGDYAALVLDKRALLALADDAGKVRLYEEIGQIYLDKLHNLPQGIAAYQSVLAIDPGRRQTLHKLLELFTSARLWGQAADTLVRLAELEATPDGRAKYLYTAALIRRDELNDVEGAVELLNRALEEAPGEAKAFDAIERTLTEAGSWKELARNYRKMIKRLPAQGPVDLRLRLWNSLGEVSLRRLEDREMATTAFEVASSLEPENLQLHETLADLYMQAGPDRMDKAIDEHQLLVARSPDRLASYRALAKLYRDSGAMDKQWCVAATLAFLRKADPELVEFYEHHRPRELRTAKRTFTDEIWAKVAHPEEDRFVGAVFMLLGHFVAATAAQQHQVVGLRRKERVDVARDDRVPLPMLRYVAQTLELPPPDVFFRDVDPQSLSLLNLQEKGVLTPAFVIGHGYAQHTDEHDVAFDLGKRMAFLRPERFLRCAVPSVSALDIAVRSALALVGAGIGPGVYNGEVDKLTDQLRRMVPRPVIEQMAVVGQQLLSARGEVIDMEVWMGATDLTAARVGFVLGGDLPAAARVISSEPATTSPLVAKRRLKDLIAYSVSEEYFAVRKFLGLDLM